ncbi:MAG: hypothetical protein HC915_09895 [Anaerolineae bacterium]|nr:hypothetical protein [Anaerolineae bacterium]
MLLTILLLAAFFVALLVLSAKRLMVVVMALATLSVLVSVALYQMGAPVVAVIELSVGAGLVAVLFAFTNSLMPEQVAQLSPIVPRMVAGGLVAIVVCVLATLLMEGMVPEMQRHEATSFGAVFWDQRSPDVFVQMVLIFAGAVGILGLLADDAPLPRRADPLTSEHPATKEAP